jgi:hypothetical protein
MEFEFRIDVKKSHASITVTPNTGIIPANGSAAITIEFQPSVMATVFSEIEFMVSQFGFEPMLCMISGSSAPGITTIKDEAESKDVETRDSNALASSPEFVNSSSMSHDSAGDKMPRPKKKKQVAPSSLDIFEGLKIPKTMDGIHATNFVLTQQIGKLKPKDLKKAIDENRALRKRQKAEQEALRQKTGNSGGRLSFDVIMMEEMQALKPTTRQLKELVFLQDLQETDKIEKDLEFQSHREYVGDVLLNEHEIESIRKIREFNTSVRASEDRDQMRSTFRSHGSSVLSTPSMRSILPANYVPTYVPDFNAYKNNLWAKRKRVRTRNDRETPVAWLSR